MMGGATTLVISACVSLSPTLSWCPDSGRLCETLPHERGATVHCIVVNPGDVPQGEFNPDALRARLREGPKS